MKERNSNLELLRILSIFMIIVIHANMYSTSFCVGGLWKFNNGMVNGICNIGVTCFILISGYFGIRFNLRKIIKLECMAISLSLLQLLASIFLFPGHMQGPDLLEEAVKACFPFITRKYWFYSCYICLCFFSPYLNRFVLNLSQKAFEKLLGLLLLFFSILPTFFYFEIIPDNGKGLVQMIMIYLLGRYLSLKLVNDTERVEREVLPNLCIMEKVRNLSSIKLFLLLGLLWIINGISHEFPLQIGNVYHHLCKDNSITNIVMAVLLFLLFNRMKLKSRGINWISSYVFSVFILNAYIVEAVMPVLGDQNMIGRFGNEAYAVLGVSELSIFIVCLLMGILRNWILGSVDEKIADLCERFSKKG